MKYALIGTGRIAINHITAAAQNGLELVALCDIVPENMTALLSKAKYQGNPSLFSDYKALIDEIHPEFVAIATDSGIHAEIGLYALSHGCHVLIEKPIAMSMADAQSLVDVADKHGKVLAACHQNRFNPSVQRIRKAIDDGRFGKLSHIAAHVRWNRGAQYYEQASWRGKWASDGGCLMNQCIHNADLMRWFMGDIEEVFAYTANTQHDYIEGEDIGLALVKGANGAYGLFEGTVNVFPKNLEETLYVFGDKGTVKAGGTSVNLIDEWLFADELDTADAVKTECNELPPNVYGFGHTRLYADVLDAIKTGRKPLVDGVEGMKALELILAMYKSKKTGQPVRLPLGDFASVDMVGVL